MSQRIKNYGIVSVILILISCFFGVCVWNSARDTAVNFGNLQDQGMEVIAESPASFLRSVFLFLAILLAVFAVFCRIQKNPYLQQGGANRLNQRTFLTSHL